MCRTGVVVYRSGAGIDAIDEYSRRLVGAMVERGGDVRYVEHGVSSLLSDPVDPAWIALQYNPFHYGKWGFAPGLIRDLALLRHRRGIPVSLMIHEAWVPMSDWRSTLMGLWQRVQLRALVLLADSVMTSTEVLAREVGCGAVHVPVASNITPVHVSRSDARERLSLGGKLVVGLFGRAHPSRALDYAQAAVAALAEAHGADQLAIMNLGADAPPLPVPAAVEVRAPGRQTPEELSIGLSATDVVLLPFSDGISTRRGTLMAALAHGRPVVGLNGRNTDRVLAEAADAIVLTPVGDPSAFVRATLELARDPDLMRTVGEAGQRLYESRFGWPVLVSSVSSQLDAMMSERTRHRVCDTAS